MNLRIFHTGDLHIGLRYTHYPEKVRELLGEARIQVLERMVSEANRQQAQLFVIAGDLFDHHHVASKTVEKVQKILNNFEGNLVLVLPGNHDFDDGMQNLWNHFQRADTSRILVAAQKEIIHLGYFGLPAAIYPCPCDQKHSHQNNLNWIPAVDERPEAQWHIGIAHGALQNLSPDLEKQYFNMTIDELMGAEMDLWLLGHTHIAYPDGEDVRGVKIFNAGTPEPDGMDCRHRGGAWLIDLNEMGNVHAQRITTGQYRFRDEQIELNDSDDLDKLEREYQGISAEQTLLRLAINGSLEQSDREKLQGIRERLYQTLLYLDFDDTALRTRVTPELIQRQFSAGSFPLRFLNELQEHGNEQALQLAYELVLEVKKS